MKTLKLTSQLSCEQVYQIWTTEPEVIQILDLRSPVDFDRSHIPQAINITETEASKILENLNDRLAVFICSQEEQRRLSESLYEYSNFVFMRDCERWLSLEYPMEGSLKNCSQQKKF